MDSSTSSVLTPPNHGANWGLGSAISPKSPVASSSNTSTTYHPDFSEEDADIVLLTCNNVRFRVYSVLLKKSSPFFRDMFKLPCPSGEEKDQPIPMTETGKTVELLLRLCHGMSIQALDSMEVIGDVLEAAMKYQMEGPSTMLARFLIPRNLTLKFDPLKLYVLGCKLGIEDIAKDAATLTLDVDIHSAANEQLLSQLNFLNHKRLEDVRRRRRKAMAEGLSKFTCSKCKKDILHTSISFVERRADKWMQFTSEVTQAMEARPSKANIESTVRRMFSTSENNNCVASNSYGGGGGLTVEAVLPAMLSLMDSLPEYT